MYDLSSTFVYGYGSAEIIEIGQDLTQIELNIMLSRFCGPHLKWVWHTYRKKKCQLNCLSIERSNSSELTAMTCTGL